MGKVDMDPAARERMTATKAESRGVCWVCGRERSHQIHGIDGWWQHEYEPAILTKMRDRD